MEHLEGDGPKTRIFFVDPHYMVIWNELSGKVRVFSYSSISRGRELTQWKTNSGYLAIKLGEKRYQIHQLIGDKIFNGRKKGYCVNHKDGNKLNNSRSNLEYITIGENVKHAVRIGLHISSRPLDSGRYKHGRAIKGKVPQYKHEWYLQHRRS